MSAGDAPDRSLLPEGLADWVEAATGARLVEIRPHAGVGVSREGAFVTLDADGETIDAYLAYDVRRVDDPTRPDFVRREAAAQQAARDHGLRAPQPLARWPERRAILTRRLPGDVETDHLSDARKLALAEDYIGDIARLHRIDTASLGELDGFGPPIHPSDYIRKRIALFRQRHHRFGRDDPFMVMVYRWLEENVPAGDIPTVVVHGDVGSGNFLHDGERVTGVLDWEQAHYGDPMEDFGWLILRLALFPFVPIRPLIAAYEAAGGYPVARDRIRYYRVLCQASSMTDMCGQLVQSTDPFAGNLGHVFAYYFALRKLTVDALLESEGIDVEPIELPEPASGSWARLFGLGVDELTKNIAPRSADAVGSHRANSFVRLVHYWQGRDRYGAAFDAAERDDIAGLLGTPCPGDLAGARTALAKATDSGAVSLHDAIAVNARHMAREIEMAKAGLGHLAGCSYPPLD